MALILAYVDRELAHIDALVAEQRRLIELLKEKRQAVISHAVTKGLNTGVPMKPSNVAGLGDVPTDWSVVHLKYLCTKIGSGKTPSGGAETYVDSGVLFIRSQNVDDHGLRLDDVAFIDAATDQVMSGSRGASGDVLLNITGASLGRTCLVPDSLSSANVNQHVCILRLRDPTMRHFVALAMKSSGIKAHIDVGQNGAAREGLNFHQIRNLRIAVPPAEEQHELVEAVEKELAQLDVLQRQIELALALLQERRAALISAAVTGQIDVRGLGPSEVA
jgi:type I restriction enzyme S subunit